MVFYNFLHFFSPSNFQLNILYLLHLIESAAIFSGENKKISYPCSTNGPYYFSEQSYFVHSNLLKNQYQFYFSHFLLQKYSPAYNLSVAFLILECIHKECKKSLRFISRIYELIHLCNEYLLYTYHVSATWNASTKRTQIVVLQLYILERGADKHNK